MSQILSLFGLVLVLVSSGCALCSDCEDSTYAAYGGRWQRHDRVHGRVGSVLHPAGGRVELPVEAVSPEGDAPEDDTPEYDRPEGSLPGQMETAEPIDPWPLDQLEEGSADDELYYAPAGE